MTRRGTVFVAFVIAWSLLACGGGGGSGPPELVLPEVTGWTVDSDLVELGEPVTFRLELDWKGQPHEGLLVQTFYDLGQQGERVWEGDHYSLTLRTTERGVVEVGQYLTVCRGSVNSGCEQIQLTPARARVRGGTGDTITSPARDTTMVVGEVRPFQATVSSSLNPADAAMTNEPITYVSDSSILDIDDNGFATALAVGTATLYWSTGNASHSIVVEVVDGALDRPSQGAYRIERKLTWPSPDFGGLPLERPLDSFAIGPNGYPAFVMSPLIVGDPTVQIVSQPLYFVEWTGSGFGYEQVSEWYEAADQPFLGVGIDGHKYVGWLSDWEQGFVVRDRAPGAREWQRRLLPLRPDLSQPADSPNTDWTFHIQPLIATLPSDTGVWVAYAMSYNIDEFGYFLPDLPFADCYHVVRLAHVTPTQIEVEDVVAVFPDAESPEDYCVGDTIERGPKWVSLDLAPPVPGGTKPVVVGSYGKDGEAGAFRLVRFEHGASGWEQTRDDNIPGAFRVNMAVSWSPYIGGEPHQFESTSSSVWTIPGPDGTHLGGRGDDIQAKRALKYGGERTDSVLGPHFPVPYALGWEAGRALWAADGDDQRAYLMTGRPPTGGTTEDDDWIWLYVSNQPRQVLATGNETEGQRLWGDQDTLRYHHALVLDDSTRLLFGSLAPGAGMRVAKASGPAGAVWTDLGIDTSLGTFDPANEDHKIWSNGQAIYAARPGGTLWRSDNGAGTWTNLGTLPTAAAVYAAVTPTTGVHFILGADGPTLTLWRVTEGAALGVTVLDPLASGYVYDPDYKRIGMYVDGTDVVIVSVQRAFGGTDTALVTSRYDQGGNLSARNQIATTETWWPGMGTTLTDGTLVVPVINISFQLQEIRTSSDDGQTWSSSPAFPATGDLNDVPPLIRLSDGRLVLVHNTALDSPRWSVRYRTSTNGLDWSSPVEIRPNGGGFQRAFVVAPDASGGFVIHMGDAGSIAGWFTSQQVGMGGDPHSDDGLVQLVSPP